VDPSLKVAVGISIGKPKYGFVKENSAHDAAAAEAAGSAMTEPAASGSASSGTIALVFQRRTIGSFQDGSGSWRDCIPAHVARPLSHDGVGGLTLV
jgi:hypothetical protein